MKNKQNLHAERELILKLLEVVNSQEEFYELLSRLHHLNSFLLIERGFEYDGTRKNSRI